MSESSRTEKAICICILNPSISREHPLVMRELIPFASLHLVGTIIAAVLLHWCFTVMYSSFCLFQVTAALVSVLSIFCSCLQSRKVGLLSSDLLWLVPARPQICLSEKVVGISLLFLSNHSGISLSHINVSDKLQAGDGQKTVFPCCKIISDFKNCPILFWDKYFSRYCMFTDRLRELEVVWGMAHVCRLYHPHPGQEFGQSSARPTRQLWGEGHIG